MDKGEIGRLLSQAASCFTVIVYGPQSAEAVAELVNALHVRLPASYVTFLREYGCIVLGSGFVLAGIHDEGPRAEDMESAYGATMHCRESFGMPDRYVVIQYDSEGEEVMWCLDTAAMDSRGECPVVAVRPDGSDPTPLAGTFGELLEMSVRDYVA